MFVFQIKFFMHENFLKFHIETLNVLGFNILLIARTTFSNQSFIRIRLSKDAHFCVCVKTQSIYNDTFLLELFDECARK